MDRFFGYYERAVQAFSIASLLVMILCFALWVFLHGGVTGALDRLMTGQPQPSFGQSGALHLQDEKSPPDLTDEQPELIL